VFPGIRNLNRQENTTMGMKPRVRITTSNDPMLQVKATEAVEAAACYLQEETKVGKDYRYTDDQAFAIIRRTANQMAKERK
jgi:hypothetical protein